MSFQDAVRRVVLEKYADFNGRARRSEFWYFVLFQVLVGIVASILDQILGTERIVSGLVSLALLLPGLAVGARRLHDTGRSGWWQLLSLTIVGIIVLIVWWAGDSHADNAHGPSPKAVSAPVPPATAAPGV